MTMNGTKSCPGKFTRTPRGIKKVNLNDSSKKSARKRLIMIENDSLSNREIKAFTKEAVLEEISTLSPMSPSKLHIHNKENFDLKHQMVSHMSPKKKSKNDKLECRIIQSSPSSRSTASYHSSHCDSDSSTSATATTIAALHHSLPENIVGRDEERKEIINFIRIHAKSKTSASMYISGAPGTGKTACLLQILPIFSDSKLVKTIFINCMTFRSAQKIYQKVACELGATANHTKTFRNASNYIEEQISKDGQMLLLILDEMDQLDSKNQEVLYMMFSWIGNTNSHLILIGIANSLNLTDRMLPRLQTTAKLKPKLLNFKPYSREELLQILQGRVQTCTLGEDSSTVIDQSALQFCARKVAATSGDARKALDVCRRAVEIVETNNTNAKPLLETSTVLQKVGVMQISRVFNGACDAGNMCNEAENSDTDDCFPLQQKLLVSTLVLLCKNLKCKETSLGKLYESYTRICKKRQVPAVSQSEFHSLSELVETRGIISVKKAKQLRQSQVKLNIHESDVEFALMGKALLSSILNGGL